MVGVAARGGVGVELEALDGGDDGSGGGGGVVAVGEVATDAAKGGGL